MVQRHGQVPRRTGEWALPSPDPGCWLALAGHSRAVGPLAEELGHLLQAGHRVSVGFVEGPQPASLPAGVDRHRLSAALRVPARVRPQLAGVLRRATPSRRLSAAVRLDPWLGALLPTVDHLLLLDDAAAGATGLVARRAPHAGRWTAGEVAALVEEEARWRYLDHRVRRLAAADEHDAQLPLKGLAQVLERLESQEVHRLGPPSDFRAAARELALRLLRRGRPDGARTVLRAADLVHPSFAEDIGELAPLRAVRACLDLDADGSPPPHLAELARRVFVAADAALERDDLDLAAGRAAAGLELLFHQRLHTDSERTPLVEDPRVFLRPFTASRVGAQLTGPVAGHPVRTGAGLGGPPDDHPGSTTSRRVVVLPGSYPWHAEPLLAALRRTPGLEVTELAVDPARLRGMGLGTTFLRHRLERARGAGSPTDLGLTPEQEALLRSADVVVADWADRGAVWVSTELAPGARLVVRVHSVDALSPALHLVDWSRVSDLVVVGPHMRDVLEGLLGDRLSTVRTHVVPNIVPPRPLGPVPDDGHLLAMVGWGKRVKDPLLAVEILAALRRRDPAYRLRLIGAPLARSRSAVVDRYTLDFRERIARPDVDGAVELVGQTDDVPAALDGVAFVLSTSLRESFHIGVMEGVQAGAFPVVREWPAYARHRGARRVYPAECVVETAAQAAALVERLAGREVRAAAVDRVRQELAEVLDAETTARRLVEVVLDGQDHPVQPSAGSAAS